MKERDLITRYRILRAAKAEFARSGFAGARLADIAKRAQVNKALIHYYFKNKDTLYFEVLKEIFGGTGESEAPLSPATWPLSPRQKLYAIIYFFTHVHLRTSDSDADRILFWEMAEGKKYLKKIIREYMIPRQAVILQVINEGIEQGEFETANPLLVVMNLFSFISYYTFSKDLYRDTPVYQELYGPGGADAFFQFALEQFFRMLSPAGKAPCIPAMPGDLLLFLDRLMELLHEKREDPGVTGAVVRQMVEILSLKQEAGANAGSQI